MKASDITEGGRYLTTVHIPAGPSTPRTRATQHATVVAKDRTTITVEVTEPVCTNAADHAGQIGWAMANGLLHWDHRPVTRQVRAADVLAPITLAEAGPAPSTELATAAGR